MARRKAIDKTLVPGRKPVMKIQRIKLPRTFPKGKSKFRNVITISHGIKFHSKGEAERYEFLFHQFNLGKIQNLQTQIRFDLHAAGGVKVCSYVADFTYDEWDGTGWNIHVVEDYKGFKTDIYKLKKKWMLAEHGIEIRETKGCRSGR